MPVVRWKFEDPVTLASYTFAVNPSAGGSPLYRKNVVYQNTTAPGGTVLIFEGQDEAKTGEFSGTILEEPQYAAMYEWFTKRYIIKMTDDLGRVFNIYITEFSPQRERAFHYPYKHSYTVKYTIVS